MLETVCLVLGNKAVTFFNPFFSVPFVPLGTCKTTKYRGQRMFQKKKIKRINVFITH
jgi:hypothetical protein